jgi:hypothetical protein
MTKEEAKEYIRECLEYHEAEEIIKALDPENCEDAISRKVAKENALNLCLETSYDNEKVVEMLDDLPPVKPVQKKGKFENKNVNYHHLYGKCSECGQEFCVDAWYTQNMKYCPNCGAEMTNL